MLLGTVVGNVWATKKDPTLVGVRFLVIRPFTTDGRKSAETLIAADPIGAGIGERVQTQWSPTGNAARSGSADHRISERRMVTPKPPSTASRWSSRGTATGPLAAAAAG